MKRRLPKLLRSKIKPYRAKSRGFGRGFETLEERTLMAGDGGFSLRAVTDGVSIPEPTSALFLLFGMLMMTQIRRVVVP